MSEDALRDAMGRSEAAAIVLEKHKAALFPHLAVLLMAFGPANLRNIVAGAVEATIIAAANAAVRESDATVLPFPEDRP